MYQVISLYLVSPFPSFVGQAYPHYFYLPEFSGFLQIHPGSNFATQGISFIATALKEKYIPI